MAYETMVSSIASYPQEAKAIRPEPMSPGALGDLGRAATDYAAAAAAFIEARYNLDDARERYSRCADIVAKSREQENV